MKDVKKILNYTKKKEKRLNELVRNMNTISNRLCPDEESDCMEDGEEIFNKGRSREYWKCAYG